MPGETIEVRSAAEIAKTLDESGCLDKLPFMPEMAQYCGRQFSVYRRADKTCDTVNQTGGRRLYDTVHLSNVRCDGSAHGGCEASCLLFWKEDWLKRSKSTESFGVEELPDDEAFVEQLQAQTTSRDDVNLYTCQATALPEYTTLLHWWDVRQYVRDLRTGNTSVSRFIRVMCLATFRALLRLGIGARFLIYSYNKFQKLRNGQPYPVIAGQLTQTPIEKKNLQPGELVRVKSLTDITRTLDKQSKNRGMRFDPEMVKFCGGTYRVAKRVEKIIEEKSGRMLHFGTPSVILEDVFCHSEVSNCRLFCPRSIVSYWREIWLDRVADLTHEHQPDETL